MRSWTPLLAMLAGQVLLGALPGAKGEEKKEEEMSEEEKERHRKAEIEGRKLYEKMKACIDGTKYYVHTHKDTTIKKLVDEVHVSKRNTKNIQSYLFVTSMMLTHCFRRIDDELIPRILADPKSVSIPELDHTFALADVHSELPLDERHWKLVELIDKGEGFDWNDFWHKEIFPGRTDEEESEEL